MNRRQLIALWIGIGVSGVLLLFPPQVMMPNISRMFGNGLGNGSSLSMPAYTSPTQIIHYSFIFTPTPGSVGIVWIRLLLPVLVVALLIAASILTFQTPKQFPRLG